jgi:DUF2993 family protein
MRRLLIFLVFVVILLVAVDRGAWYVAERGLADEIRRSQHLDRAPDVSITGFPFLTQALAGDYTQVDGTLHDLSVENGVTVSELDVRLRGVHVALRDLINNQVTSAPVDSAAATALVTYPALDAAAKANITDDSFTVKFGPGTDGHLKVSGRFRNALVSGSLNGEAEVRAENGDLVVGILPESLAGVPQIIRSQLASLVGVSYKLPALPFGFRARSVTVGPEGIQVTAAASNVELTATP